MRKFNTMLLFEIEALNGFQSPVKIGQDLLRHLTACHGYEKQENQQCRGQRSNDSFQYFVG